MDLPEQNTPSKYSNLQFYYDSTQQTDGEKIACIAEWA